MFQNGNLMLFGDLRHLTSTVDCPIDIRIGADICDPWERAFNQNPDIGVFFRFFHLNNPVVLGVCSTLIFFLITLLIVNEIKPNFNMLYIIFLSPPLILGIDRGNEIITISLILLAILFCSKHLWKYYSLLVIGLASVFKFWPVIILIFWTLLTSTFSRLEKVLICSTTFTYLATHLEDLRHIANETQLGDLNGGSFGIKLIEWDSNFGWISLLLIVFGSFFLKQTMKPQEVALLSLMKSSPMLTALFFTYLALFVTGSHFNYRLIVLIPIALIIGSNLGNEIAAVFIVAMMITSRLNVIPITSTIFAIYLAYILAIYFARGLGSRKSLKIIH
jgi:hypothetical protein